MAWEIVYYRTADGRVPALEFLIDECPPSVEADLLAALSAVADAPPPAFAGGGRWEAMHGAMGGYYEVRTTGPGRRHYRLFCLLERVDEVDDRRLERSAIAVITGMWKPNATLFTDAEYRRHVRVLGDDYRNQRPRRIAGERDLAAYLARAAAANQRDQDVGGLTLDQVAAHLLEDALAPERRVELEFGQAQQRVAQREGVEGVRVEDGAEDHGGARLAPARAGYR